MGFFPEQFTEFNVHFYPLGEMNGFSGVYRSNTDSGTINGLAQRYDRWFTLQGQRSPDQKSLAGTITPLFNPKSKNPEVSFDQNPIGKFKFRKYLTSERSMWVGELELIILNIFPISAVATLNTKHDLHVSNPALDFLNNLDPRVRQRILTGS